MFSLFKEFFKRLSLINGSGLTFKRFFSTTKSRNMPGGGGETILLTKTVATTSTIFGFVPGILLVMTIIASTYALIVLTTPQAIQHAVDSGQFTNLINTITNQLNTLIPQVNTVLREIDETLAMIRPDMLTSLTPAEIKQLSLLYGNAKIYNGTLFNLLREVQNVVSDIEGAYRLDRVK
jgi:hypothetical protein